MADKHRHFLIGLVCVILASTVAFYDFINSRYVQTIEIAESKVQPCQKHAEAIPAKILPLPIDDTIPKTLRLKVGGGDTLANMIQKQGVANNQIHQIVHTIKNFYKPRELRANHIIELTIAKAGQASPYFDVHELKIRPALEYEIIVSRTDKGIYEAQKRTIKLTEELKWVEGEIYGSLSDAAHRNGVPHKTVHDMIMVYSYDVDFQRQLQQGDRYCMLYSVLIDPETGKEQPGKLIYAGLNLSGKEHELYSYKSSDGIVGFYTLQGESVRKGLLRTPIDGARISSGYGHRHHPVLGYTKHHKGVDFRAPTGTPIMAAGDGIVEQVGRWGNYGNYVKIRHNSGYATAYAHLSRYAKGLRRGQRICQGQVLGYVGATGRTTGPHLHYEVIRNNHHINPLSIKMLPAAKLGGSDFKAFKAAVMKIKDQKVYLKENFKAMQTAKKSNASSAKKVDQLG
jgi:murein DD-endopeptidase MepM/ murein hydrolase activator NlpD